MSDVRRWAMDDDDNDLAHIINYVYLTDYLNSHSLFLYSYLSINVQPEGGTPGMCGVPRACVGMLEIYKFVTISIDVNRWWVMYNDYWCRIVMIMI